MEKANQDTLRGIRDALEAGHSFDEIADNLASRLGIDLQPVREAGWSSEDIVVHMVTPQEQAKETVLPQRSFGAGVGRGMEDVAAGAADLLPDELTPDSVKSWLNRSANRAATYDEANKDIGFDGGRVAGTVAALGPLMMAGPAVEASVGRRVATNAAVGGVSGYIPRAKDESERRANAAIGVIAGAAVPEVVRGAVSKVIGGKNAVVAATKDARPEVTAAIADSRGISLDEATALLAPNATTPEAMAAKEVEKYLSGLATDQLKASGKLNPAILARAAKIAAVDPGIRPTLGQLTRDPAVLSAEQNLMKSGTQAGNKIADRMRAQDETLRGVTRNMMEATGGRPLSPYEYGGKAGEFLRGKWKEMQQQVGAAYKAVEQRHGDVPVDVSGLIRKVADTAYTEGGETASGKMSNIALNRLKSYGLFDESGNLKEGAHLTINQLRDLRQTLGAIDSLTGTTPAQAGMAKSGLINAIDDAVEASPVGDVFKPARDLARTRFSEFSDKTLKKIQSDNIPDEKLFDFATGRNVDTAKDYVKALTTGEPDQVAGGQQILADTRRKMLADVLARGESGIPGEETLMPKALRNAIDPERGGYDPEVLDTVLGDQAGKLRDVVDVVGLLRGDPSHNSINYSKSGALLAGLQDGGRGLVSRLSGVNGLLKAAGDVAGEKQQNALAEALLAGSERALPGFERARVVDALSTDTVPTNVLKPWQTLKAQAVDPQSYKAMMVNLLLNGARPVPSAAANQ